MGLLRRSSAPALKARPSTPILRWSASTTRWNGRSSCCRLLGRSAARPLLASARRSLGTQEPPKANAGLRAAFGMHRIASGVPLGADGASRGGFGSGEGDFRVVWTPVEGNGLRLGRKPRAPGSRPHGEHERYSGSFQPVKPASRGSPRDRIKAVRARARSMCVPLGRLLALVPVDDLGDPLLQGHIGLEAKPFARPGGGQAPPRLPVGLARIPDDPAVVPGCAGDQGGEVADGDLLRGTEVDRLAAVVALEGEPERRERRPARAGTRGSGSRPPRTTLCSRWSRASTNLRIIAGITCELSRSKLSCGP